MNDKTIIENLNAALKGKPGFDIKTNVEAFVEMAIEGCNGKRDLRKISVLATRMNLAWFLNIVLFKLATLQPAWRKRIDTKAFNSGKLFWKQLEVVRFLE